MNQHDCIVSLTSFPKRVNLPETQKVLFSIINQKTKYKYKIILVLCSKEFSNKEHDLSDFINKLVDRHYIEILWVEDNLKAYKKLYPVQQIYKDIPIITTDDDILLTTNAVETIMDLHIKNPDCILTQYGWFLSEDKEVVTGFFRLFPPDSLLNIDCKYFVKYYNSLEDDLYLAVLAHLKHTKTIIFNIPLAKELTSENLTSTALRYQYWDFNKNVSKVDRIAQKQKLINALKRDGII